MDLPVPSLAMAAEVSFCAETSSDSFNTSSFIELEPAPLSTSFDRSVTQRKSLTEINRIKTLLDDSTVSTKRMSDTSKWPKNSPRQTRVRMPEGLSCLKPSDAAANASDSSDEEEATPELDYSEVDGRKLLEASELKKGDSHLPYNVKDFLTRLESYDILRWNRMPDCISAFHCARFGWMLYQSIAVDVLICVTCKRCKVLPMWKRKILESSINEAKELREELESTLHEAACMWRKAYSPLTILTLPKCFELFKFLLDSVSSFKSCDIDFQLKPTYQQVLETVDLKWMVDLIGEKCSDLSKCNRLLFLTLNGWYYRAEVLECSLCLRKVPLWAFKKVDNVEEKDKSYLDPVNNHHWYCPWRKFLEFATAADVTPVEDSLNVSYYERRFEDSTYLRAAATLVDYERLQKHMIVECDHPSSFHIPKVKAKLVHAVSEVMDGWISNPLNRSMLETSMDSPFGSEVDTTTSPCTSVVLEPPQLKRGVKRKLSLDDPEHSSYQD